MMDCNVVRLWGLSVGVFLAIAPNALAESKRGWQDWQLVPTAGETYSFDAGFSNSELGIGLDYQNACKQQANELAQPVTYWYRLSNLVEAIGTGEVEFGCQVGGDFVENYTIRAVQVGLDSPVCLRVQSDFGNGLYVREDPAISSPPVGVLSNGAAAYYAIAPALISLDPTGRPWLNLQRGRLQGWSSIAVEEGAYVNFRLCDSNARS